MNSPLILVQTLPEVKADNVNEFLSYALYVLLIFIVGLLVFVRKLYLDRITDLKGQITLRDEKIKELEKKIVEEIDYNKQQGIANIKLITDTENMITTFVSKSDKNNDILVGNSSILKENAKRVKEIYEKITKNG